MEEWKKRYNEADKSLWKNSLAKKSKFLGSAIKCKNLHDELFLRGKGVVYGFIGFACDEGDRRSGNEMGSAFGPREIRRALSRMPLKEGFDLSFYDFGDVTCTDGKMVDAQKALAQAVGILLTSGVRPVVLGGSRELSLGQYLGLQSVFPSLDSGIVRFDNIFGLKKLGKSKSGSSETSFYQIAKEQEELFLPFDYMVMGIQPLQNSKEDYDSAKENKVSFLRTEDLQLGSTENNLDYLDALIRRRDAIYLSLDLGVFDSAFSPGVSSVHALGLAPWQVLPFWRRGASSGKVVVMDITGLNPLFDTRGKTASLAASLIWDFIHSVPKESS